jgi:hypothetical protein
MRHKGIRSVLGAVLAGVFAVFGVSGVAWGEGGGMLGDPDAAAQYWARQVSDDCALMAVADVVGELTGVKPSEDQVIALAVATPSSKEGAPPIYTPAPDLEGPVPPAARRNQLPVIRDLPVLLAHYGVPAILTDDTIAANGGPPTGIPGLQDALSNGMKAIISLNGETIWDQPGDRSIHDHDVVVTGLDTAAGIVHLNDSAAPGPNSQIPIDVFDTAWRTSAHSMVLAG